MRISLVQLFVTVAAVPQAAIDELLKHVEQPYKHQCKSMLRGEAATFGQAWQDWYIFHNHFSHRTKWGDGTYVDIGTNEALSISNTLFFDKCLGWRGVCFEPQSTYHGGIRRNRGCTLIDRCVGGTGENAVSGHMEGMGADARFVSGGKTTVTCVDPVQAVRPVLGMRNVDLINIDIEGGESMVLNCFPLDGLKVEAVLIETNKADLREVDLFFHRHGFVNDQTFLNMDDHSGGVSWLDNLYVRRSTPPVFPPSQYTCNHRNHRNRWCGPWTPWKNHTKFGPCPKE